MNSWLNCVKLLQTSSERELVCILTWILLWIENTSLEMFEIFVFFPLKFTKPNIAYCGWGSRSLASFSPVRPRCRFFPLVFNFYMTNDRMFWYSEPRSKILLSIWGASFASLPIHIPVSLFDICILQYRALWLGDDKPTSNLFTDVEPRFVMCLLHY